MASTLAFWELEAEVGMPVVDTVAKMRRAYFVLGKSIKAICREMRLSRKAVRKAIRSGATEFHYEREVQPLPKIGQPPAPYHATQTAN